MPISTRRLREAGGFRPSQRASTLNEARQLGLRTAFLCHSHKDQALVYGLISLLKAQGWNVYVDWLDAELPTIPNRETAAKIKQRIVDTHWFLFLATHNSMTSRWCPWEIGYADGKKPIERILVIPTQADDGTTSGNEYLQLYRRIDATSAGELAAWSPGDTSNGTYIRNLG